METLYIILISLGITFTIGIFFSSLVLIYSYFLKNESRYTRDHI